MLLSCLIEDFVRHGILYIICNVLTGKCVHPNENCSYKKEENFSKLVINHLSNVNRPWWWWPAGMKKKFMRDCRSYRLQIILRGNVHLLQLPGGHRWTTLSSDCQFNRSLMIIIYYKKNKGIKHFGTWCICCTWSIPKG